jgi:hypothetical protein
MLVVLPIGVAAGCGGGSSSSPGGGGTIPGTPAGTSTITVTGTAGSGATAVKQTTTIQLTARPRSNRAIEGHGAPSKEDTATGAKTHLSVSQFNFRGHLSSGGSMSSHNSFSVSDSSPTQKTTTAIPKANFHIEFTPAFV